MNQSANTVNIGDFFENPNNPSKATPEQLERLAEKLKRIPLGLTAIRIACEKSGRSARLMELDPRYCDVIRRRWAEFVHGEGCDWENLTPAIAE